MTNVDKWRYATLPTKRRFQTYLATLVNKTWLSEAYKNHSTLADTFLLTRIEPEGSKIVLAHAQFSRSATLPTLVYGHTSVRDFGCQALPLFSRALKRSGRLGMRLGFSHMAPCTLCDTGNTYTAVVFHICRHLTVCESRGIQLVGARWLWERFHSRP